MTSFNLLVQDIKDIRIQGASNIAKAAVKALEIVSHEHQGDSRTELLSLLNKAKTILFNTRPTEPCMRNTLNYVLTNIEGDVVREIRKRAEYVKNHFEEVDKKISEFASRKISNSTIIFTHCHSSSVMKALINAKQAFTLFEVHNTATLPLYPCRITAT